MDSLGFGFTSEGIRKFRAENPDVYPQVAHYIRTQLEKHGVFPKSTNLKEPGFDVFIQKQELRYILGFMKEVGMGQFVPHKGSFGTQDEAIRAYVSMVANPDYLRIPENG